MFAPHSHNGVVLGSSPGGPTTFFNVYSFTHFLKIDPAGHLQAKERISCGIHDKKKRKMASPSQNEGRSS